MERCYPRDLCLRIRSLQVLSPFPSLFQCILSFFFFYLSIYIPALFSYSELKKKLSKGNVIYDEIFLKTISTFKAKTLRSIASVYQLAGLPMDQCPFFIGIGNRVTDARAYNSAGCPLSLSFFLSPIFLFLFLLVFFYRYKYILCSI